MQLIETYKQASYRTDWRSRYRYYQYKRPKHQYWLHNRRWPDRTFIDIYDQAVVKNCQPGISAWYSSAGYYAKSIFPEIQVIETDPVVKDFFPEAWICQRRSDLIQLPFRSDNFVIINNHDDQFVTLDQMSYNISLYTKIMNPNCRFFYSFRDTGIFLNRLTHSMQQTFIDWAHSLKETCDLTLVWSRIDFKKKTPDSTGNYSLDENPDFVNGNIKFWFVYQGQSWLK